MNSNSELFETTSEVLFVLILFSSVLMIIAGRFFRAKVQLVDLMTAVMGAGIVGSVVAKQVQEAKAVVILVIPIWLVMFCGSLYAIRIANCFPVRSAAKRIGLHLIGWSTVFFPAELLFIAAGTSVWLRILAAIMLILFLIGLWLDKIGQEIETSRKVEAVKQKDNPTVDGNRDEV